MHRLLFLVAFLAVFTFCVGKDCKKQDRCNCVFDDDSGMMDLWSLAKTDGTPLFFDVFATKDIYMYSFNPCIGFAEGTCADVAVCQHDYQYTGYYDLGRPDNVAFSYDGLNVVATYTSQDGSRNTYVTFVCDPTATTARIDVLGETDYMKYYMTVTAAGACPIPSASSNLLSAGSVILIIFFVLFAVYIITGVVFNKVKRQAAGKELVPNKDFWLMIPGLVKDGCAFVMGLICRGRKSVYISM